MYLIYDTETTGLPKNFKAPVSDSDNWPRCVQLAWQLHDASGKLVSAQNYIIKPDGYTIPFNAVKVHGISTERAQEEGYDLDFVLDEFEKDIAKTDWVIGHNIEFDVNITGAEYYRRNKESSQLKKKIVDTKDESTEYCAIPGGRGGKFKWPTLTELHTKLFGVGFDDAHDAAYDVDATAKCFFGLLTEGVIETIDKRNVDDITYEAPQLAAANFAVPPASSTSTSTADIIRNSQNADISALEGVPFSHLHVHSQFSVLESTTNIESLVSTAKNLEMPAIALTDNGNMMAAFHFVRAAIKAEIKPIVGCEFNVCKNLEDKKNKDNGFHQVLLAKNKAGYHNIAKLSSIAFVDGKYYVPRIDKKALEQYKDNLIATTGGLWSEIPFTILNYGAEEAEEVFLWYKELFGEDFYVELNRHGIEEEEIVNKTLIEFAKKHSVKYFAANNTYYSKKEDAAAHDILLCVKDGEVIHKPKKWIGNKGREYRYGFPNEEFYIKSQDEMKRLFADMPEAIHTTNEIVNKVESFELESPVLLPAYDIPEEFQDERDKEDPSLKLGENNLLRHLTYEGAKKRYQEITPEIEERLDFELEVIRNTGYPGYFLIVQDFCEEARRMGVSVGPGRGSAAGSAVAYCIGITNVDPIHYDLLFERFLNPDRVSMPDIDIDFDDEGRGKVIQYVVDKYGANQVAQIITYGTMAAKSAIRDTSRALDVPLSDADRLAKLVPDIKLNKLFSLDDKGLADKLKQNAEAIANANELKHISGGSDQLADVINNARLLEGSVRNTGIHACGVIITPDDITKFVPVALAKDSDMYCTQFDNSVVEDAGLLKMDFLGLKTLTLIKDACRLVKEGHDVDLDPDNFPIDDVKTYELFQRGETVGIFQYESPGMQKYMRELKPTVFADLIAMNALYRPGPLEYIPSFIRRKHGDEEIQYDLADMQEYLEETYGITVYQEQVMRLSQKLADFTKGEADVLRKAMGKKQMAVLDKMKPKFIEQASAKGHDAKILEKVWKDWEAFASYAFNKSHSTCYAWIAYQTAYLKAHYPAEYMAAVLSNNMGNITDVSFFMEEAKRMGLDVLGPDVNESQVKFAVNDKGQVRFGLGAMKGSGDAAVRALIEERDKNGPYKDIFDFASRVNLRAVNKKTMEVLAQSGAFDGFEGINRRQYLEKPQGEDTNLIDKVVKFANKMQAEKESAQASMFGGSSGVDIPTPSVTPMEEYGQIEKLNIEKEVVGLYITGHPLDEFKLELISFCQPISKIPTYQNQDMTIGGCITSTRNGQTKRGKPYGVVTIEDYSGKTDLFMMGDTWLTNAHILTEGQFVYGRGNVKLNWRKENERKENPEITIKDEDWEFAPTKFELLADMKEKVLSAIQLDVNVKDIDQDLIDKLEKLVASGVDQEDEKRVTLRLNVFYDGDEGKFSVDMLCRKYKVNANNNFLNTLESIDELDYKVIGN